jgi:hypothetical protein
MRGMKGMVGVLMVAGIATGADADEAYRAEVAKWRTAKPASRPTGGG